MYKISAICPKTTYNAQNLSRTKLKTTPERKSRRTSSDTILFLQEKLESDREFKLMDREHILQQQELQKQHLHQQQQQQNMMQQQMLAMMQQQTALLNALLKK